MFVGYLKFEFLNHLGPSQKRSMLHVNKDLKISLQSLLVS